MTEQERFHFGYVCGDTGLIDEQAELKWFIENCCSIKDLKKNWKTVCDKLNEVNEENEKLKEEKYAYLGEITLYKGEANKRKKENEDLKKRIEYFKEAKQGYKADWKYASARAEKYEDKCDSLQDEKEELEQIIKEAYNILQEADLFSDKATNHDTIAYKEMLKFDNKDAYTIANGIKEALKILKELYK